MVSKDDTLRWTALFKMLFARIMTNNLSFVMLARRFDLKKAHKSREKNDAKQAGFCTSEFGIQDLENSDNQIVNS